MNEVEPWLCNGRDVMVDGEWPFGGF